MISTHRSRRVPLFWLPRLLLLIAVPLILPIAGGCSLLSTAFAGEAEIEARPDARVALQRLWPRAQLSKPVHLAPLPGMTQLVVVEQTGAVRRLVLGAASDAGLFLDLRRRVSTAGWEEGLLSIAFHPGYARNRRFFVYFSAAAPRRSIVAELRASADGLMGRPETLRELLVVAQPFGNHNGGQLAFGPDGMLYIALGDGGSAGDPHGNGQNRGTLLGSLLRIDVDRTARPLAYAIPPDNPYAGNPTGFREEIWAWGLRNPWRFSFDRATGKLFAADVGQDEIEEVNRIVKGGNYGWNLREGTRCYAPATGCASAGLEAPIAEYNHEHGRSITGGFVYRGRALPALIGRYLFADFLSGSVWDIPADAPQLKSAGRPPRPLFRTNLNISSFGEDAAGELYVLDLGRGAVFKLVPAR